MVVADTDMLKAELVALLGVQNVLDSAEDLEFYSTDIYRRLELAELVVRPGSAQEVAAAVRLCAAQGRAIVPRGGGLSYTNGYTPARPRSIMFDLTRLDQILEINADDMFVVVEGGVTWHQLYEALKRVGLRTPYFGTASGFSSTVGGAMSQHSSHFASAQFGISADSALGLEVVLADGSLVHTGSWSSRYRPSPFFRHYGPDLTGLFLGDTGALGLKTKVALKLIPFPAHQAYGAYAFDSHDALLSAMIAVGKAGLAAECGGWDPVLVGNYIRRTPHLQEDLKYLSGVVRSGAGFLDGLKDAARIAMTGRRAFKDVSYLMNVTIDEASAAAAQDRLQAIEKIASSHGGRSVEPTFPRAHRGTPFAYPNGILGPTGKRWSPTHGLAPHSRAHDIAQQMFAYFDERSAEMERNDIEWGLIMSEIGGTATLIEPMFYWPDRRSAFHERWIEQDFLAALPAFPPNPDAATLMHNIRVGLTDLFMRNGCTHFQIGKFYPYREGREETAFALLQGIKRVVDPQNLMNPGALGLA